MFQHDLCVSHNNYLDFVDLKSNGSKGNGMQGFQTPITNDSFLVDGIGALGNMHSERGQQSPASGFFLHLMNYR